MNVQKLVKSVIYNVIKNHDISDWIYSPLDNFLTKNVYKDTIKKHDISNFKARKEVQPSVTGRKRGRPPKKREESDVSVKKVKRTESVGEKVVQKPAKYR